MPEATPTILGSQPATELEAIRHRAAHLVSRLRLPFRSRVWRGQTGHWLGAGVGSSVDFQDHRPYVPGDDPRYINWHAYARTGHYTMKLYREEVSPAVDIALDISASMSLTPAKTIRTLELLYVATESAFQTGASMRLWLMAADKLWPVSTQAVRNHHWAPQEELPPGSEEAPPLERISWRTGSLRVVISDLLFPGQPETWLNALTANRGHGVLLAPVDMEEEAEPSWDGNLRLMDCETRTERLQRLTPDLLARYRDAYRRHYELWKDEARRREAVLARVPAQAPLLEALSGEAATDGALEWVN